MEWVTQYPADVQPTQAQIAQFVANALWADINEFLQEKYEVKPVYSYSGCNAQPGWNVKYQKGGKSLCTLYPMDGFFIALVVIGAKQEARAALLAPTLTQHVQQLLKTAGGMAGARWLMIHVTNAQILADVKTLIQLRRKPMK